MTTHNESKTKNTVPKPPLKRGQCPHCGDANLFTADLCIGCRRPITPSMSIKTRPAIAHPLVWGSALVVITLGAGLLAYRYDPNSTATNVSSTRPAPQPTTTPTTGALSPPPTARVPAGAIPPIPPEDARHFPSPRPITRDSPRRQRAAPVRRKARARQDSAAPPQRAIRGGDKLSYFIEQDVQNLAGQIRAASTREELLALMVFVGEVEARYRQNQEYRALSAFAYLTRAIHQKLNGPNPAGLTFWQDSLKQAEVQAHIVAREVRTTPEEQRRESKRVFRDIQEYEKSAKQNAPSRRVD